MLEKSGSNFRTGCLILAIPFVFYCLAVGTGAMSDDLSTIFGFFCVMICAAIAAIVFWVRGTAKAVKEVYVYTRAAIIDLFTIKDEIRQKCPAALKAKILEKKQHSLNVGIFDQSNTMYEKMTIAGNGSVADDVYVGQVITF